MSRFPPTLLMPIFVGMLAALSGWALAVHGARMVDGTPVLPLAEAEKARDWQVFNHFVDEDGKMWTQADGFGLASAAWQDRDWLLQWVEIPIPSELPPGDYFLRTGMYSLVDGTRSPVLDTSGQAVNDLVELGPFSLFGAIG